MRSQPEISVKGGQNNFSSRSVSEKKGLVQGVEPCNFHGSGSVWIQQRFQISVQFRLRFKQIETFRFGFAPVKNISKPVYKVPVQVRSKKWYNSCNII